MYSSVRPASILSTETQRFLNQWGLEHPKTLKFNIVDTAYLPNFCHASVKHKVEKDGGERIHGWTLWEFKDANYHTDFYETIIWGDFHSVWKTPEGELVEITPPKYDFNHVLFAVDPELSIQANNSGHRLYNSRTSSTKHPIAQALGGLPTNEEFYSLDINANFNEYCNTLGITSDMT